ncbi:glycosyltransferase family protein [Desulfoplanes sp.]
MMVDGIRRRLPRIFFINLGYYLSWEIPRALEELQCPFLDFQPGKLRDGENPDLFFPRIVGAISRYKPDMVLTVNALGLDTSGRLADFLDRSGIPLVVWFVDNPELFCLGCGTSFPPKTLFFTCDPDGPAKVRRFMGVATHVLPLAVDRNAFQPIATKHLRRVSFAGDTWTKKVVACHKNHAFSRGLLRQSGQIAGTLAVHQPADGIGFIQERFPLVCEQVETLSPALQNGFWHLVYWLANKNYRLNCVREILRFRPLIVGDRYWERLLPQKSFEPHPPVAYGEEVFKLYRLSAVNFACSSVQMAGAVTQRVFDVPASGGFVLTDSRRQLEDLFDIGKEVVCYGAADGIGGLIERYLGDETGRKKVIKAARRRIASEHTYAHRLRVMVERVAGAF